MCCGATRRSAATNSAAISGFPDLPSRCGTSVRVRETNYGRRTASRPGGPWRPHHSGDGAARGAPSRTAGDGLELALGSRPPRRIRHGRRDHHRVRRSERACCCHGGRAGDRHGNAVLAARPFLAHLAGWCLITPHRVRKGCVHAWVQNRTGQIPVILSTAPARYGQEVRLWLRAGLTAGDLEAASQVLAAACWAAEVRIVPSGRYAHLVTLEIVRRRQPEPARPAPRPWPDPRYLPGGGLSDAEDRDTTPGPAAVVPWQRTAVSDDWRRTGKRTGSV